MKLPSDQQIWQNSWVVPDVEAAAMQWVRNFGVGPFFITQYGDDVLTDLVYRGQPGTLNIMVALSHAGPVQVELIQCLDDNPTPYRDTVKMGQTAFHHVAVWTDDMEADLAHYEKQGNATAISGRIINSVRFAYVDTHDRLGCMVEMVERSPEFDARLRMLEDICLNWDGSDPLREIPAIGQEG